MTNRCLDLDVLPERFSIVRLSSDTDIPEWIDKGSWYSITRTPDECSVVCESRLVPDGVRQAGPWQAFRVRGPLNFEMTGVLRRIAYPLSEADISIFALSTYDTDYVLVRVGDVDRAAECLRKAGFVVRTSD